MFTNNKKNKLADEPHLDKEFLEISEKMSEIYKDTIQDETNHTAYQCIKNLINQKIQGNIVECGVWRGEKISVFLETLNRLDVKNRDIYIIDTFSGMTEPGANDLQVITQKKMIEGDMNASLEIVKNNIYKTDYPREKLHFIKIDVRNQNDLKNSLVGDIAL